MSVPQKQEIKIGSRIAGRNSAEIIHRFTCQGNDLGYFARVRKLTSIIELHDPRFPIISHI